MDFWSREHSFENQSFLLSYLYIYILIMAGLKLHCAVLLVLFAVSFMTTVQARLLRGIDDVSVATSAQAQANAKNRMFKDKVTRGKSASARLQADRAKADRIAANSGMKLGHLMKELESDDDIALDTDNERALYICAGMQVEGTATTASSAFADSPEPAAVTATAFALHSRPGSRRVIYLDFDGHQAVNTAWNAGTGTAGTITTPAYSIDADPAFSEAELSNMVR